MARTSAETDDSAICLHKRRELIDIQPGSTTSVGGGLPVAKGEKSSVQFLSFFQCKDCGEVFSKEVRRLQ